MDGVESVASAAADAGPVDCSGVDGGVLDDNCDTSTPPLVNLLSRCRDVFAADFERRLADSEFSDLSLSHSKNVLRHLGAGPMRASQIVDQCGVSKQAVSQQLVQLERNGYVDVTPDPRDHRARLVTLTDLGAKAQQFVHQCFTDTEHDWAVLIGARDAASLRRILTKLLDRTCL